VTGSAGVPETIAIDARFNGPPESANGGYTCGLLAEIAGEPLEVSLRQPPPLGRGLQVERTREGAVLRDGDDMVAEASRTELDLDPPEPPDVATAHEAERGFPFARQHPFPTCFVCGPERPGSDGLRIFPGPVDGGHVHAAAWTPAAELAGGDAVRPRFVWAALDCPTSVPVANDATDPDYRPIVLARLAARRLADVEAGRPHVIVSWPIGIDGRKRQAGSALFTDAADLCAYARALWIELR
jgi:hypothetical protein